MLKVTKQGRVRIINETDLENHKQMGWSVVEDVNIVHESKKTKTKKTKSVDVKEEFEKELETAIDEVTPTEEN